MKIAVIGAGIIGVTTAYELASDGHEVVVLERRGAAAEEASFATAGLVATGYVTPWAAPGMPLRVIKQLFSRHTTVRLGLPLSLSELSWIWQWFKACKLETYLANRAHMQRLALYSQERLHHLTADLKLEYDRSDGQLVLLRTEQDSKLIQPSLQVLRDAGVSFKELGPQETQMIEGAINTHTPLFGSVHLPNDEVGNCRQFALLLKNEAQRRGVTFRFNTTVTQISHGSGVKVCVAGETAEQHFDAAVICAGLDSTRLLGPLNLKIPMMAVSGYSVSAHIRETLNAPQSAVMDEHYKVAISRLGNRVRVAGNAEIGGPPGKKRPASLQTLYKVLNDWFPGAANLSSGVQEWKGARPMLPDGPPALGSSGLPGIWLNLGHGASGWTLSCGSARAVADLVGDRTPDLDIRPFHVARLSE
jgi:D-amino-acid dehydrogenase